MTRPELEALLTAPISAEAIVRVEAAIAKRCDWTQHGRDWKRVRMVPFGANLAPVTETATSHMGPPEYLRGLRPDGTCDEGAVDGALVWEMMLAVKRRGVAVALVSETTLWWAGESDKRIIKAHHAHPAAALALVMVDLGLFKEGAEDAHH